MRTLTRRLVPVVNICISFPFLVASERMILQDGKHCPETGVPSPLEYTTVRVKRAALGKGEHRSILTGILVGAGDSLFDFGSMVLEGRTV